MKRLMLCSLFAIGFTTIANTSLYERDALRIIEFLTVQFQ